jgi:hypothetical protein
MVVLVENRQSIPIGGQAVSLVNLGDVLGLKTVPQEAGGEESWPVIVLLVLGLELLSASTRSWASRKCL